MISSVILIFLLLKQKDRVRQYIYAVAMWTLICFAMTEIMSVFKVISTRNLWIAWLSIDIILLLFAMIKYKSVKLIDIKVGLKGLHLQTESVFWIVFALAMLGLAVKMVPYNYDSMTYHLPRIFHWAQNGSVDFYATSIDRQVGSPIGGAYIVLHTYVMAGENDRFVNLLQCCSFLTNGVLVYYIAKKIGCSVNYCKMAMLFFYSMPIAFAEAFTTQVDNFAALWMLSTVYLLLDMLRSDNKLEWNKETFSEVCILSLCVGFGYLTKPSVGIGLLIFAIWLLIMVIRRRDKVRIIVGYLFTAFVILAVIVLPGFARNLAAFDALSAPNVGQRQLVGTLNPKEVFINCTKNIAFNMPTVWIYNSTKLIHDGVSDLSEIMDVDINNPAISEDGKEYQVHDPQTYGCDTAVNPILTYLLIICIVLWILQNRKKKLSEIKNSYFIVAGMAFIVFCALLRWQPYVSRYMISYLAVLCPALAGQLELFFETGKDEKKKNFVIRAKTLIYFLCIVEFCGLGYYHGRIAINGSRYAGYFRKNESVEESYRKVADYVNIRGYENVGLYLGGNTYEYPLLVMLENDSCIRHVNVSNATAIYEDQNFVPDIIVSIDSGLQQDSMICHGAEYKLCERFDANICLLEKVE